MNTPLLAVENLSAGYDQAVVLNGISFSLQAGQTLALLGRNGTGKTTLIDTLMGATTHHSGRILWQGANIAAMPSHHRAQRGLGWVPQERNIFKSLTVHENLIAVARASKIGLNPWTPQRVYELFPRLAERRSNLGNQLSGGEQQMLAVGRALVLNPQLLLLDEPLEGLAPVIVQELLAALQRITRDEGIAAIIVEQHPQAILAMSHSAVVLDHGSVVHSGDAKALLADDALLNRLIGVLA
jgi:branched-chain amino acid transport system ATP-binding protein